MNTCSRCGNSYEKKIKGSARCQPCRTEIHREYCQRVDYHKQRYKKFASQERERHLVKKYGMTQFDYDKMFQSQNGKCAICLQKANRPLDVDHCHKTGVVRGLLCTNCNRMLGHAHDSTQKLLAAVKYLEKSTIVPQVAAEFITATIVAISHKNAS